MKKIVLLCAGGASTGILVNKMRAEATKIGVEYDIEAFAVDAIKRVTGDADCVLIGPQVAYKINDLRKDVNCPIEAIDMRSYGMMDGAKVLSQARKLIGDL